MNCKPGDLALVIRATCANEGRLVTVVKWVSKGEKYADSDGFWNATVDGWRCTGRIRSMLGQQRSEGVFPDAWLLPIRGNAEKISETSAELIGGKR